MLKRACAVLILGVLVACASRISLGDIGSASVLPDGGDGAPPHYPTAEMPPPRDGGCAVVTGDVLDPTRNCVYPNSLVDCENPCVINGGCGGAPEGACFRNSIDGRIAYVEPGYTLYNHGDWNACTDARQLELAEHDPDGGQQTVCPGGADGGACYDAAALADRCPATWDATVADANASCAHPRVTGFNILRGNCSGYLTYAKFQPDANGIYCLYDLNTGRYIGASEGPDNVVGAFKRTCGFPRLFLEECVPNATCNDVPLTQ